MTGDRVHFVFDGRRVCPDRHPHGLSVVTEDPSDVTCPACREAEDFLAALEFVELVESLPEATDTEPDRITVLRRALAERRFVKIDGVPVDIQTTNAIITVYDAPQIAEHPTFRKRFVAMPIEAMARTAWKLVQRAES